MVRRRAGPEPRFLKELCALGAPEALVARLLAFLETRHPGDQERIYHGLAHTHEVADLTARLLHSWPRVPANRKILLILAAALHDVDPERPAQTPARVEATLAYLSSDAEARSLLGEFGTRFGFTTDQVGALIMATDYSPHPYEMQHKLTAFQRAHRAAFGDDPWISEWGRRLSYWDRISTYLHPLARARRRVAGLGRELRAQNGGLPPAVDLRAMSRSFLLELRADPLFTYLPAADRDRFDAVLADFEGDRPRSRRSRRALECRVAAAAWV